jgi:Protein phosphatase 2C
VFAVPEQLVREVSPRDRFIVVASDGVFEFLTSQTVRVTVALVTLAINNVFSPLANHNSVAVFRAVVSQRNKRVFRCPGVVCQVSFLKRRSCVVCDIVSHVTPSCVRCMVSTGVQFV